MSGLFDQITNYSPPLLTAGQVNYKGTWDAAANSPTLTSPPASTSKGDYYVVSTAGTQFGITFAIGDWIISNGTAWEKVDLTDAVSSVFGRTGAVVGVSTDYSAVGLTNTAIGASNPSTGAFTTVTASSTISATGAVTGSNLSGTNTGDQTTITGNAGTATALQTARTIGGSSFDGTANVTSFPVPGAIGVTTPAAANFTSIGVTTQGTGAFTTGTFTGNVTVGAGSTTSIININGSASNDSGPYINFRRNSVDKGYIGTSSAVLGGASDALVIQPLSGNNLLVNIGGTGTIATFSSTGLAVTGALSSTSDITIGAAGNLLLAGNFAKYIRANTGSSADLRLGGWNGVNIEVGSGFTNVASFSSTGLAVTGTLSATGAIEGANVIRTNGPATADKAASAAIDYSSGFHRAWCWGPNTSTLGQWKIRLVRSDGSAAVEPVSVSSTGLAVTGQITATGNVGIGTSSPSSSKLVIESDGTTFGTYGSTINLTAASGTRYHILFRENGTERGSITSNGITVAYNSVSDYRLKDITGSLTDSGTFIDALKPKVGTWKSDGSKFVGFLAHEFAEVSPSSVSGEKDAVDADGNPKYQGMQAGTAEVIANLVAELQSLRQRVAALESN